MEASSGGGRASPAISCGMRLSVCVRCRVWVGTCHRMRSQIWQSSQSVCVIVSVWLSPFAPFLLPPTILSPGTVPVPGTHLVPCPLRTICPPSLLLIPSGALRQVKAGSAPLRSSPYVSENPERGEN